MLEVEVKKLKIKTLQKFWKPLIAWSIIQALKSKIFKKVYVSTDSKKIAKISKKYGAEVPFLRSKKLSNDKISKFLVWKDAIKKLKKFQTKK